MEVDVVTEVKIGCPVAQVAAFAMDPANAPAWYTRIRSVEWRTEPPAQVGSKIAFVARFLGRRLAYTYEVVELTTDERLVMRTSDGPFPMETTYAFDAVDAASTHMTLRNRGTPAGFSRLATRFMIPAMRRANRKDLERLRTMLEAPPPRR